MKGLFAISGIVFVSLIFFCGMLFGNGNLNIIESSFLAGMFTVGVAVSLLGMQEFDR